MVGKRRQRHFAQPPQTFWKNPQEPANSKAFILEFKVRNPGKEKTLEETAKEALLQIKEKKYEEELLHSGVTKPQIHCYGFAFEGKKVLIAEELPD